MNHRIFPILVVALVAAVAVVVWNADADDAIDDSLVVGTYDSRCIAVAFTRSGLHSMDEQQKAYEKARQQGDKEKMAELEKWGETQQRKAHFMAFGQYPVHNVLEKVSDKLPAVAQSTGVDVIVCRCDFTDKAVKTVDVTDELVALFDPDEKTLKTIASLKTKDPVPFETLIRMGHNR